MDNELQEIKALIDKVDIVSFDVFDTLLLRNLLKPTDLFLALDKFASENYEIKDFHKIRIEAESNSRINHKNSETDINSIYEEISKKTDKYKELLEKELYFENKFLVANPFMKKVYEYAKKKGKKLYAISDMYLNTEFIENILNKNGYLLDKVFVSSDGYDVKGNGSLFKKVEKEEGLSFKKWLHIGDNKKSDYEEPIKLGMTAYHYKNILSRSGYKNVTNTLEESIIKGIQQNYIYTQNELTFWEKFGIECCSPLYYGFTNFIYNLTKGQENVYFLARDGYVVKKLYDMFCRKLNRQIDTYYLYCSRASIQIPCLVNENKSFAMDVLTRFNESMDHKVEIKDIFNIIGLDISNYLEQLKIFNLKADTYITNYNKNRIRKFLAFIYDDIMKKLESKKEILLKYLEQMNFQKYNTINLVDIGWTGSIHTSLQKLLKDKNMKGYYFGTRHDMNEIINYNSFGWAFDNTRPEYLFWKILNNVMMYEFIFSAPHGSTKGFKEENGEIVPILDKKDTNNKIVEEFQNSAIQMCEMYLEYYEELFNTEVDQCINQYDEFINKKEYESLVAFCNIKESVGYEDKKIGFVKEYSYDEIWKDLPAFFINISKSLWPDAFLIKDANKEEFETKYKFLYSKKAKLKYLISRVNIKKIKKVIKNPKYSKELFGGFINSNNIK